VLPDGFAQPLAADHIDVVHVHILLRRESFNRPETHVPDVMNNDIKTAGPEC